ncbi:hypothetical protein CVT24_011845 [Panaeolus cyanescens]|uniref:Uncharacterized protein n=1 Tax=Panaeolus cyanescens TaxID=181874 RepID=A0A409YNY7_9AGAR|nr:hypothetical protein CVT24_011845 [Panaeolus cyanescens]
MSARDLVDSYHHSRSYESQQLDNLISRNLGPEGAASETHADADIQAAAHHNMYKGNPLFVRYAKAKVRIIELLRKLRDSRQNRFAPIAKDKLDRKLQHLNNLSKQPVPLETRKKSEAWRKLKQSLQQGNDPTGEVPRAEARVKRLELIDTSPPDSQQYIQAVKQETQDNDGSV